MNSLKLATSRYQPWHVLPNHRNYQEDLHKQYEAEAESRTKTNLVIEAVAKAEGFDASEEEIQKKSSNWQQTTTWKLHKYKTCFQLTCWNTISLLKKPLNWSQALQQLNNLKEKAHLTRWAFCCTIFQNLFEICICNPDHSGMLDQFFLGEDVGLFRVTCCGSFREGLFTFFNIFN